MAMRARRLQTDFLQEPERLLLTSMLLKTIGAVAAGAAVVQMLPGAATTAQLVVAVTVTWVSFALAKVLGRASAARWPQAIAMRGAMLMRAFSILLWPAYILLRQVGAWAGGANVQEMDESVYLTDEGLRLLMDVGDEEPILDSEKQMIASILEMDETGGA